MEIPQRDEIILMSSFANSLLLVSPLNLGVLPLLARISATLFFFSENPDPELDRGESPGPNIINQSIKNHLSSINQSINQSIKQPIFEKVKNFYIFWLTINDP